MAFLQAAPNKIASPGNLRQGCWELVNISSFTFSQYAITFSQAVVTIHVGT
jgi:hypothetical protein